VTVVERKNGYAVMAKVSNKTADLVGAAIIEALSPMKARVKTLTYDNGKKFSGHARIDEAMAARATLPAPLPVLHSVLESATLYRLFPMN
jgi:IS30 family transposase